MPTARAVRHDCDLQKGGCDKENPATHHLVMTCQLPHRSDDEMIKDADTDFPEPGFSPEHS
jgi:hypothetical protein